MSLVAALPVAERGYGPFLDELYAAALEPARFAPALNLFEQAVGADDGRIVIHDRLSFGIEKAHFVDLTNRAAPITLDPQHSEALVSLLADRDPSSADLVLAGSFCASRRPDDALSLHALHYMALIAQVDDRWLIAFVALRKYGAFSDREQNAARAVVGDIRRALTFHLKATRSKGITVGDRLFETAAVAMIVTRQRLIEHTNDAASRLLETEGPIRIAGRNLRFEDVRVAAAFDELSKPSGRSRSTSKNLAFIVTAAKGDGWLVQLSRHPSPAPSPLLADTASAPTVIAALTPLNGASGSRGALIDGFIDLTATERSVLAAFVDGKDIARIATDMQRSIETVRWHVRNLFAKLGVKSQADLTRLGSLLLPI